MVHKRPQSGHHRLPTQHQRHLCHCSHAAVKNTPDYKANTQHSRASPIACTIAKCWHTHWWEAPKPGLTPRYSPLTALVRPAGHCQCGVAHCTFMTSESHGHPASTSAASRGCTQCMHDTATRHVSNPMCTCCHMHTHPPCKHTCVSSRPLSWLTGAAGGSTQHDECTIITTTNMRTPATNVARRQIVCSCCTTHTTY